ncbi:hypothetical protein [Micromonospora inyonensis]|nr:hypothetical protein [Micromonospora inyonensis]
MQSIQRVQPPKSPGSPNTCPREAVIFRVAEAMRKFSGRIKGFGRPFTGPPRSLTRLLEVELPPPVPRIRRILKNPRVMPYHRLIVLVVAANVAVGWYAVASGGWWAGQATALTSIETVALANVTLAVVVRQQWLVNALFWLATRAPTTWPLPVRWALAKIYHFGGLHVGAAVSGTTWYLVFVVSLMYDHLRQRGHVPVPNLVVSGALVTLFVVMSILAVPPLRVRAHDTFEVTHRFCGWAALALAWINTVLSVTTQHGGAYALLTTPTVWLLTMATVSVALPWLLLRKVRVDTERPSAHVAVVNLDSPSQPLIGSTQMVSRRPLLEWHSFANISAPEESSGGHRMVVSRAGDWTSDFIDNPPTHLWVRGMPTAGMANVAPLFRKVLFVATGSGIGPVLAHLLTGEVSSHLVWVTRNPRRTYGALVDEVLAAQPDAVIWDTDAYGKPDMLRLAYGAYATFGAEAVICVANKKVTWQVVHGLELVGVPAYGPIWDA